jgi:MFS family permease
MPLERRCKLRGRNKNHRSGTIVRQAMDDETSNDRPPRRHARGRIVFATAVMLMGSTLPTPLYALYRRQYGFSELTLTLIYAAYALGNFAALLLLGRLSDQIGRRRTALPALALGGLSTACFLCAFDTAWLFVGRALSGAAIGLFSGAMAAWITDLVPGHNKTRSSVIVTSASYAGLLAGPLAGGILAQYVPAQLRVSYAVLLGFIVATSYFVWSAPETIRKPVRWRDVSLKPRIGVPAEIRAAFVSPALTAFATFALIGFYAALAPTVMQKELHVVNRATSGAVVAVLFLVGVIAIVATSRIGSRRATLGSLGLLLVSLAVLVLAYVERSMATLLVGTSLTGISAAVGFRGSLEVVTDIAPEEKRAEVISAYFVVGYLGNSVPVIGVGVLTQMIGSPIADLVLTLTVAVLAVVALVTGIKRPPAKAAKAT